MGLVSVMNALEGLYGDVAVAYQAQLKDALRVYRWKPDTQIELPAIYTWTSADSTTEGMDATEHRLRDYMRLNAMVASRFGDADEQMARAEQIVDIALPIIDLALSTRSGWLLKAGAKSAKRLSFRPTTDRVGDFEFFAIGLALEIHVDRVLTP